MAQLLSFRVYLSAETQKASAESFKHRIQKTRKPFSSGKRGKNDSTFVSLRRQIDNGSIDSVLSGSITVLYSEIS